MIRWLHEACLKFPSFRGKHRIESSLRRRLAPKVHRVARGLRMELDPREWAQMDLIRCGALEPKTVALIERLLPPGGCYVDVGSHVGFHALIGSRAVGPA